MVAEEIAPRGGRKNLGEPGARSTPRRLAEIQSEDGDRVPLQMDEFARVLGGGIIPGSVVLIGGDPGIASQRCSCKRR